MPSMSLLSTFLTSQIKLLFSAVNLPIHIFYMYISYTAKPTSIWTLKPHLKMYKYIVVEIPKQMPLF